MPTDKLVYCPLAEAQKSSKKSFQIVILQQYLMHFLWISWDDKVNTMATDALAPCITRSSTASVLSVQDKRIFIFYKEGIQQSYIISALKNDREFKYLCFVTLNHQDKHHSKLPCDILWHQLHWSATTGSCHSMLASNFKTFYLKKAAVNLITTDKFQWKTLNIKNKFQWQINQNTHLSFESNVSESICCKPGLILGLHPANERRRYKVTQSLIGWAQT